MSVLQIENTASIKIHVANRSTGDAMIDIALSSGDGTTVTSDEYLSNTKL